jgi:hypothetical protein
MGKATQEQLTATEIEAEATLNPFTRQHTNYERVTFSERDMDGGLMEGTHMMRLAPVRALEGLAVTHPKRDRPFLCSSQVMAANKYHDLLEAAHGRMNHEINAKVDKSGNPDGRTLTHLEANDRLSRVHRRMAIDHRAVLDLIYIQRPKSTMANIWPNRTLRNRSREIIGDALAWLAVEFGYTSH